MALNIKKLYPIEGHQSSDLDTEIQTTKINSSGSSTKQLSNSSITSYYLLKLNKKRKERLKKIPLKVLDII